MVSSGELLDSDEGLSKVAPWGRFSAIPVHTTKKATEVTYLQGVVLPLDFYNFTSAVLEESIANNHANIAALGVQHITNSVRMRHESNAAMRLLCSLYMGLQLRPIHAAA